MVRTEIPHPRPDNDLERVRRRVLSRWEGGVTPDTENQSCTGRSWVLYDLLIKTGERGRWEGQKSTTGVTTWSGLRSRSPGTVVSCVPYLSLPTPAPPPLSYKSYHSLNDRRTLRLNTRRDPGTPISWILSLNERLGDRTPTVLGGPSPVG